MNTSPYNFHINYKGRRYNVLAEPVTKNEKQAAIAKFKLTLESHPMGALVYKGNKWLNDNIIDQELIDMIGSYIYRGKND